MIDYIFLTILISLFLLFIACAAWIAGDREDIDDDAIVVQNEDLAKINERQDYLFFGNEDKKVLYEKLVKAGASREEALSFIS